MSAHLSRRHTIATVAGAVAAIAAIAYPLTVQLTRDVRLLGAIVSLLAVSLLIRLLLSRIEPLYKGLGVALVTGLAIGAWWLGPADLLTWQPALLNGTLLMAFAASLRTGMPLIERIARVRAMPVGPHNLDYLRGLTAVWAGFFAVATSMSVLAALAEPHWWLWWNGRLIYVAIAALVIGERLYRLHYRRQLARQGRLPDWDRDRFGTLAALIRARLNW